MTDRFAGILLIFSAVTFWLAWLLMPDAGTNDAAHILEVVRSNRTAVWGSVVVQITSSVAFVFAIMGLQASLHGHGSAAVQAGASLVLVGVMGMCADAFFHLAAYYMTAEGIAAAAVLEPMRLLQTEGIRLLAPLLLSFFIGGWVYARELRKGSTISRWPERIFVSAFTVALAGAAAARGFEVDRHPIVLGFLGVIALGYAWIGLERALGLGTVRVSAEEGTPALGHRAHPHRPRFADEHTRGCGAELRRLRGNKNE